MYKEIVSENTIELNILVLLKKKDDAFEKVETKFASTDFKVNFSN